jgi:hypothetical protein
MGRLVGMATVCFGVGILLSFLLPGYILALLEALAVIVSGILLLGRF